MLAVVLRALASYADKYIINATGDYLMLPNHQEYSDMLGTFFNQFRPYLSVTTNAGFKGQPKLNCSEVTCSLNALDAESFDKYIGLEIGFKGVVENIRYLASTHGYVEVHSLRWEGNPDPEKPLLALFGDTKVRIRISEKVENQFVSDVVEPRKYCEYLDMIVVNPIGQVKLCAHDFWNRTLFGTVGDIKRALANKEPVQERHRRGDFEGLCAKCNFNLVTPGRVYYIQ